MNRLIGEVEILDCPLVLPRRHIANVYDSDGETGRATYALEWRVLVDIVRDGGKTCVEGYRMRDHVSFNPTREIRDVRGTQDPHVEIFGDESVRAMLTGIARSS